MQPGIELAGKRLRRILHNDSHSVTFEAEDVHNDQLVRVTFSTFGFLEEGDPGDVENAFHNDVHELDGFPRHPNLQDIHHRGHFVALDGKVHMYLVSEHVSDWSLRSHLESESGASSAAFASTTVAASSAASASAAAAAAADAASAAASRGSLDDARSILRSVATGLFALHHRFPGGVIDDGIPAAPVAHGNLRPENVMRTAEGEWKLTEFGAARFGRLRASHEPEGPNSSNSGIYASLDRIVEGKGSIEDDIWALGIMGLELVLRRSATALFPEVDPSVTQFPSLHLLHLAERVRDAKTVDHELGTLVGRMLEPRSALRPTIEEVLDVLEGSPEKIAGVVAARWCPSADEATTVDVTDHVRRSVRDGCLKACVDAALIGREPEVLGRLNVRYQTTRNREFEVSRWSGMWIDVPCRSTSQVSELQIDAVFDRIRDERGRLDFLRGLLNRVGRDGLAPNLPVGLLDSVEVRDWPDEERLVARRLLASIEVARQRARRLPSLDPMSRTEGPWVGGASTSSPTPEPPAVPKVTLSVVSTSGTSSARSCPRITRHEPFFLLRLMGDPRPFPLNPHSLFEHARALPLTSTTELVPSAAGGGGRLGPTSASSAAESAEPTIAELTQRTERAEALAGHAVSEMARLAQVVERLTTQLAAFVGLMEDSARSRRAT